MKTPTIGHVKAIDYSKHGILGGLLTDMKIARYILSGHYGEEEKEKLWSAVLAGRFRKLDKRIRRGDFGPQMRQELNRRRPKGSRKARTSRRYKTDLLSDFM